MQHYFSSLAAVLLATLMILAGPPADAQTPYVVAPTRLDPQVEGVGGVGRSLSGQSLRRIDGLAMKLVESARELSLETSEHFVNERHSEKLGADTGELMRLAEELHLELHRSQFGNPDASRLREHANEFIEIVARLPRTIGLLEEQPKGLNARQGIPHMYSAYREAHAIAMEIDRYLPVDTDIVDRQADRLTKAVEELDLEFAEHLQGYELSGRIRGELLRLSQTATHIHDIAHQQAWSNWQMAHIASDVQALRAGAREVEQLIRQQSRRGIRSADWAGVEHSLDAITDIHAAAYLLEHMVTKFQQTRGGRDPLYDSLPPRRVPRRDLTPLTSGVWHDGHSH